MVLLEHDDGAGEASISPPTIRRADDVAENCTRLDACELEGIADKDERRLVAHRLEESSHERQRDH